MSLRKDQSGFKVNNLAKFKNAKVIGSGAFGDVLKARNSVTDEIVAIKKMKKRFTTWEECMALREVKSLCKLNHENIVKLKEVIREQDELNLVFEYLEMNLFQYYEKVKERGGSIPEDDIRKIMYQTIAGLAYMHRQGFFHRDMKPENLLMTSNLTTKIADFGLAREIRSRPPFTDYVSTRWYRAPEILLKSTSYNSPVDIFATGCIMAEIFMLSPLFMGQSEMDQLFKVTSLLGTPTQRTWPEGVRLAAQAGISFPSCSGVPLGDIVKFASKEAVRIISDMISWDPTKRPTAEKLLSLPYFQGSPYGGRFSQGVSPGLSEGSHHGSSNHSASAGLKIKESLISSSALSGKLKGLLPSNEESYGLKGTGKSKSIWGENDDDFGLKFDESNGFGTSKKEAEKKADPTGVHDDSFLEGIDFEHVGNPLQTKGSNSGHSKKNRQPSGTKLNLNQRREPENHGSDFIAHDLKIDKLLQDADAGLDFMYPPGPGAASSKSYPAGGYGKKPTDNDHLQINTRAIGGGYGTKQKPQYAFFSTPSNQMPSQYQGGSMSNQGTGLTLPNGGSSGAAGGLFGLFPDLPDRGGGPEADDPVISGPHNYNSGIGSNNRSGSLHLSNVYTGSPESNFDFGFSKSSLFGTNVNSKPKMNLHLPGGDLGLPSENTGSYGLNLNMNKPSYDSSYNKYGSNGLDHYTSINNSSLKLKF
jgi:serine/threonine protein kinase